MSSLLIIYDADDKVTGFSPEARKQLGIKEARLSIPQDLDGKDIYAIARKLAELLLEQV